MADQWFRQVPLDAVVSGSDVHMAFVVTNNTDKTIRTGEKIYFGVEAGGPIAVTLQKDLQPGARTDFLTPGGGSSHSFGPEPVDAWYYEAVRLTTGTVREWIAAATKTGKINPRLDPNKLRERLGRGV